MAVTRNVTLPARGVLKGHRVLPVELVGHPAADPHAEHPRDDRAEGDLPGRGQPRQPAREHRHPVLAEVGAVEAAGHVVGQERVADLAADHRVGVQPHIRGARGDPGQSRDQPDRFGHRYPGWFSWHVDERVADVDRRQVAAVRGGGAAGAGQRGQGHRAEQAADEGHGDDRPPGPAAGRAPQIAGRAHYRVTCAGARPGQLVMTPFSAGRGGRRRNGCTTKSGRAALPWPL